MRMVLRRRLAGDGRLGPCGVSVSELRLIFEVILVII